MEIGGDDALTLLVVGVEPYLFHEGGPGLDQTSGNLYGNIPRRRAIPAQQRGSKLMDQWRAHVLFVKVLEIAVQALQLLYAGDI
jgi:hypothetical protein